MLCNKQFTDMSKQPQNKSVIDILRDAPYFQQLPEGRLVLLIAKKESSTGLFNNERLLIINGKEKTMNLSNEFPKQLPVKSFNDLKFIKRKSFLQDVEIKRSRNTLNAIQIKCKQFKYSSSIKEKKVDDWIFVFDSAKIRDEVYTTLTNVINQELIKPEGPSKLRQPKKGLNSELVQSNLVSNTSNNTIANTHQSNVTSLQSNDVNLTQSKSFMEQERSNSSFGRIGTQKKQQGFLTNNNPGNADKTNNMSRTENFSNTKEIVHHHHDHYHNHIARASKYEGQGRISQPQSKSTDLPQHTSMPSVYTNHFQMPYAHEPQPTFGDQASTSKFPSNPAQSIHNTSSNMRTSKFNNTDLNRQEYYQQNFHPTNNHITQSTIIKTQDRFADGTKLNTSPRRVYRSGTPSLQRTQLSKSGQSMAFSIPNPPQDYIHPLQETMRQSRKPIKNEFLPPKIDLSGKFRQLERQQFQQPQNIQPQTQQRIWMPKENQETLARRRTSPMKSSKMNFQRQRSNPLRMVSAIREEHTLQKQPSYEFPQVVGLIQQPQRILANPIRNVPKAPEQPRATSLNMRQYYSTNPRFVPTDRKQSKNNLDYQSVDDDIRTTRVVDLPKLAQVDSHLLNSGVRSSITEPIVNSQIHHMQSKQLRMSTDWNQELYYSSNPFEVVNRFREEAQTLIKNVVNSYISGGTNRFSLIQSSEGYTLYEYNSISLLLAFSPFHQTPALNAKDKLQRQFEDFKYLISFMRQKDHIRLPIVSLLQYKGVTALARAIVRSTRQLRLQQMETQLSKLEKQTRISKDRLSYSCRFKEVTYNSGDVVVYIDQVSSLLPTIEDIKIKSELVHNYNQDNLDGLLNNELLGGFRRREIGNLLSSLQSLQTVILSSQELQSLLVKHGINDEYLGWMHSKSRVGLNRSILASEMAANIAVDQLSFCLQKQLRAIVKSNHDQSSFKSFILNFTKDLFESTHNSSRLWQVIINDTNTKYNVKISKCEIVTGYFLTAYIHKSNIKIDFNETSRDRIFAMNPNWLHQKMVEDLKCKQTSPILSSYRSIVKLNDILSNDPNEAGYKALKLTIENRQLFNFVRNTPLFNKILIYLANFLPPHSKLYHFNPFDVLPLQPPSQTSIHLQLLKIKWYLKHRNEQMAISLLQQVSEVVVCWFGQFHPILSEFYDLYSAYYLMTYQTQAALTLAKSSLINIVKIVGKDSSPTVQKYYLLAHVLMSCSKYEQALENYLKAREILVQTQHDSSKWFQVIELKIAQLRFHFSDFHEALRQAQSVLKTTRSQQVLLNCYELMCKIYETVGDLAEMKRISESCYEKFKYSEDQETFSRMLRVSVYPHILQLSVHKQRLLADLIQSTEQRFPKGEYIRFLLEDPRQHNAVQQFIDSLSEVDAARSGMGSSNAMSKYRGVNRRVEQGLEEHFRMVEAVVSVIDPDFVIGVLRKSQQ